MLCNKHERDLKSNIDGRLEYHGPKCSTLSSVVRVVTCATVTEVMTVGQLNVEHQPNM